MHTIKYAQYREGNRYDERAMFLYCKAFFNISFSRSVGILGLKFMQLSYDTDYLSDNASVDEIRKLFDKLTEDEITRAQDMFASFRRKALQRKSSVYRLSSRRLSDTTGMLIHAAESVRNLSLSELKK